MANEYLLNIFLNFSIEVEHMFSDEEIEEAGSIKEAFEALGQKVLEEIQFDFPDLELCDLPKRRNREHKYKFKFYEVMVIGFDEDEVAVVDEHILVNPKEELEKQWKDNLSRIGYPITAITVDSSGIVDTIQLSPLSPIEMAKRLVKKHSIFGNYFLEKDEFERIAGAEDLRDTYINEVDYELRNKGYLLLNLVNEKNIIAISSMDIVMNWEQPD